MADQVADLFVTLRGINGQFVKSMDEAGAASERADGKIAGLAKGVGTMAIGFGAAVLGVAAESVKMASNFDAQMMRIHTLAGVPKSAIAGLGSQVLALAGQVGFSPNSLAEALYHIESTFASTGISGKNAMSILQTAAEGAAIGGADLVGVTNALDAIITSGVGGVNDYAKAMSVLNTIVGAGDMQMQDFVDGAGTGMLAIAKAYGASITDVGAAVATFGDNQIRGQVAATDFRMALMDLTKQGKPGQAALLGIGIKVNQLRDDLQKGGLNAALIDLHDHLDKAGKKGAQIGSFLEDAFTKKSSAPLAILMGQFDRFESKVREINGRAADFGEAWKSATSTVSTKWNQFKGFIEAGMIGLGHALTPYVGKIFDAFNNGFTWLEKHQSVMKDIGQVIRTFVVGALITAGVALAIMSAHIVAMAAVFTVVALAVGAVARKLMDLYQHNAKFRAFVDRIKADGVKAFHEVVAWVEQNWPRIHQIAKEIIDKVITVIGAVVSWVQTNWPRIRDTAEAVFGRISEIVRNVIGAVVGFIHDHWGQIESTFKSTEKTLRSVGGVFKSAFDAVKVAVETVTKIVVDLWHRFGQHLIDHAVVFLKTLWNWVIQIWNAIMQVIRGALELIKGVFDVFVGVFTGNWRKAWNGVKEIFGGIWNIIVGVLKGVWDTIMGVVKEAINTVSTVIGGVMAAISSAWGLAWHALGTVMSSVWDGIKDAVRTGVRFVADMFLGMVSTIVHAAASAFGWIPGIGPQLRKAASAVDAFKDEVNQSLSGITKTVDINLQVNTHGVPLSAVDQSLGLSGKGHATGGSLDIGRNVVGENGPEVIDFDGSRAKVYPASQSKQMGPRGQAPSIVNNFYGVAADPHTLAAMVSAEQGWQLRINQ